jgi:ABC-type amino acid transport substrate-binding protein
MWKSPLRIGALGAMLAVGAVSAAQAAGDNLLQTIKDRGVLRVCDVDYAPWNIKNPATNQWEGINIDIVSLAAKLLKVKLEHVDATWATVIPSMTTGKCDFAGAGFYITPARAELVSFTRPFATDGIGLFVPENSTAKTVEDLDKPGKTIVVRSGGYEETVAKRLFNHATVKTLTADQAGIILLEIASGRADAGAGGYYGNLAFLKANPNVKARALSDQLLTKTSIAYAVPPREYFFRDWLNAVLLNLGENGTIKEILDKWSK